MNRADFTALRDAVEHGRTDLADRLVSYRVDNAIIMAAGYSARCMPLSEVMPKGLFRVRGERLIERQIEQLRAAGIDEIIVVTGYKHEMFDYLRDKYGVVLRVNEDYSRYNNIASLYAVREYLANSYILCCDNYYADNVFHRYVYEPYYSCVYTDRFCDEFCVTDLSEDGHIREIVRGGGNCWFTIGDCYFDRHFSSVFVRHLEREWADRETRNLLMDEFHIRHIEELPLYMEKREAGRVLEFDTVEEFRAFDPDFDRFISENIDRNNPVNQTVMKFSDVRSYHSVPTEQQYGRLHLNENLFGPSPRCMEVLKSITAEDLYLYDLRKKDSLAEALSRQIGISENNLFIHNGSAEVIKSIFAILLNEGDRVLIPAPGWSYYRSVADARFAKCVEYRVVEDGDSYRFDVADILQKAKEQSPKIIVITLPQMPTGCGMAQEDVRGIIRENPGSVILLDEAYWGWGDNSNLFERELVMTFSNVIISRTFSKYYGLANIRIGYGLCSYPLKKTVGLDLPLFRASGISRKIAVAAIEDPEYYDRMRAKAIAVREWFISEINKINGAKAYRSLSNFVFIRLEHANPYVVRAFMEENGILIRLFTDRDALRLRITVGPRDIMERVLIQLKKALRESNHE